MCDARATFALRNAQLGHSVSRRLAGAAFRLNHRLDAAVAYHVRSAALYVMTARSAASLWVFCNSTEVARPHLVALECWSRADPSAAELPPLRLFESGVLTVDTGFSFLAPSTPHGDFLLLQTTANKAGPDARCKACDVPGAPQSPPHFAAFLCRM